MNLWVITKILVNKAFFFFFPLQCQLFFGIRPSHYHFAFLLVVRSENYVHGLSRLEPVNVAHIPKATKGTMLQAQLTYTKGHKWDTCGLAADTQFYYATYQYYCCRPYYYYASVWEIFICCWFLLLAIIYPLSSALTFGFFESVCSAPLWLLDINNQCRVGSRWNSLSTYFANWRRHARSHVLHHFVMPIKPLFVYHLSQARLLDKTCAATVICWAICMEVDIHQYTQ